MDQMIRIDVGQEQLIMKKGSTLEEILQAWTTARPEIPVVAAKINNQIRALTYSLEEDCSLEWLDLSYKDGERIYVRSLVFIFIRACLEIFPGTKVSIEHSLGKGLYCEIHGGATLSPRQVSRIEQRMREIADADEPFELSMVSLEEASSIYREIGFEDKIQILKYRPETTVSLYRCGWMTDYLYGYMVPSTGYLKNFCLKFYLPGVVLCYPTSMAEGRLPAFEDSPQLFKVFRQAEKWCRNISIHNAADLNLRIEEGLGNELIRVCEAQQEKQIAHIADEISMQRDRIRLILIAGPSSSGKTTFAQRLKVQLNVNGLHPVPISMDNYFLRRSDVPLDENGNQDLESIDVIDLELFNEQMTRMIQGQAVKIPHYNFHKGEREYLGHTLKVSEKQPIIVEGIHGLNEKLTAMIPKENKYKIYISALTQLNVDDHNRIPTTDTRLIRRMVRDHQFRGTTLEETLAMWPYVRRGEEKYIFPYQEQADRMFNSALIYELAVLKPYLLPLLADFKKDHLFYPEVKRLKKFLKYFVNFDGTAVPNNSILREFIGGSCFHT